MEHILIDLNYEILNRVCVADIYNCGLVCKLWSSYIESNKQICCICDKYGLSNSMTNIVGETYIHSACHILIRPLISEQVSLENIKLIHDVLKFFEPLDNLLADVFKKIDL